MPDETGLVLRGSVTDSRGRPAAGARVALAAGPVDLADIAALTGDDGSFAFGIPRPGTYRVEAFGDSTRVAQSVEVVPGRPARVHLVLP